MVSISSETVRKEDFHWGGKCKRINSRAEIPLILESLTASMLDFHYSPQDIFAVNLAMDEALVNSFLHGTKEDPAKGVFISILVSPERVFIEIRDEGEGFDFQKVSNPLETENLEKPSGRRLLLMRYYMNWVRFNAKGNGVTMCRYRSQAKTPDY